MDCLACAVRAKFRAARAASKLCPGTLAGSFLCSLCRFQNSLKFLYVSHLVPFLLCFNLYRFTSDSHFVCCPKSLG